MPVVYTVDDIEVTAYAVDIIQQSVRVEYKEMAAETPIRRGVAYFWVALPQDPTPQDYQLLPSYAATLQGLANDAETAIANRLGV